MKILLVEDQVPERRRTKELLETNGFVVDETGNAEEAIAFARLELSCRGGVGRRAVAVGRGVNVGDGSDVDSRNGVMVGMTVGWG